MNTPLKIEVGKFYRCRNGSKARIYATDGCSPYPIHGAYLQYGSWVPSQWSFDGKTYPTNFPHHIISEWIDKPEMDRSVLPAWANKAAAMDSIGDWYCYPVVPFWDIGMWRYKGDTVYVLIPSDFAPKWSGKPEDSLIVFED